MPCKWVLKKEEKEKIVVYKDVSSSNGQISKKIKYQHVVNNVINLSENYNTYHLRDRNKKLKNKLSGIPTAR